MPQKLQKFTKSLQRLHIIERKWTGHVLIIFSLCVREVITTRRDVIGCNNKIC